MILINFFLKILIILVPLLISVAYFTLVERKILGAIQRRRGPNVVGTFGLLQPLADGVKLLFKETVIPSTSNRYIFILSPIITFVISLMGWGVIPFSPFGVYADINLGVLYLFAVSSLGVYGIIMSGWSSNSKYAFLGALRSTAQMISYEVSIGFIISTIILCVGSFNLTQIILAQESVWFFIPFFPLFLMFFISALAETNRHPFDLPEAEAELVSGYNVEYSAMGFALFSLGEYSNMLLMSSFTTILFLGGWQIPFITSFNIFLCSIFFALKICFFVILYVWMRAALPRYRYDQLMSLGWKVFLPVSLCYLIFIASIMSSFNFIPL
jgi:NADH-quinone oxidoreductase subunit H